jgi:hypothetical protein
MFPHGGSVFTPDAVHSVREDFEEVGKAGHLGGRG